MGFLSLSRSPTIVPARRIYQSQDNADFKVDVDIKCCINGYLAKDKKEPATLIIFAVQLVCVEKGTFNHFGMEVDFIDKDGATNPCRPEVISSAPFSVQERMNEMVTDVTVKATHVVTKVAEVNATAGAGIPGAKAGVDTRDTNEKEFKYKIRYFGKGSSNTRCDDSGLRNGVWWNVNKSSNPDAKDDAGIPPNYLFAVLVERSNDSAPFEARIRLTVEAGWAHKMEKILQILAGKTSTKRRPSSIKRRSHELIHLTADDCESELEPVVFDPRTKFEGKCENIDREMLGKYLKEGELAKLTVIPKPQVEGSG
jgi:hypothetical protein